ncbi:MAG: hypothetical protein JJU29_13085 [Verrucomicrobia bacterium]|nr:hypothetical protein [Verrucomicrobiota bacterium]
MNPKNLHLPFLLLLTLILLHGYGHIPYAQEPYARWDLAAYQRMAEAAPGMAGDVAKPFAFRVLGPWMAGMLPGSVPGGFRILSLVASLLLPFQFVALLRVRGIERGWAVCAAAFFICNRYLYGFTVWNYFQLNDILSLNFLLLSFSALWRKSWGLFALSLTAGMMARETALLMVPVLGLWLWEEKASPRTWLMAGTACVPGVLMFLGLRLWMPTQGGRDLAEAFATHAPKIFSLEIPARLFLNAFLPFSLLPLIFWRQTLSFVRAYKHLVLFIMLVAASTLFGTNNERLMAPAFVAVYFLIARILQSAKPGPASLSLLFAAAFLASFHHMYGHRPLPDRNWTLGISLGTTFVVTLWFLWARKTEHGHSCP